MISNLAKSAAGVCAALATTAMLLTGCGGGPPRAATAPSSSSFKVALLTPGPVSDAGWNAAAFDGLQLIKRELGAETAMVQTQSPADFEDAFRDFAQRGFTVIFAHGFEYTDTAIKVAKLFPKTWFIVTSGSAAAANVASITFRIEEGAYVEGVIAGGMTKSGVVGAIGGIKIPSIGLTFDGFRQGFLSVRPGGRVSLLGIPSKPVELDLTRDVIFKGLTVQGINGRRMYETWYQMRSLLSQNRLHLEPLFTDRLALDDYATGMERLRRGEASKVLLYPNGRP